MNINESNISALNKGQSITSAIDSVTDEQYLTFVMGIEEYGVEILRVQEICGWQVPTKLPNTPNYLKGVINLRGTIVPVVDLRVRFHFAEPTYDVLTVIVVVKVVTEDKTRVIGLVVDAVSDVHTIPQTRVQAVSEVGTSIDVEYLQGVSNVNNKMIILLNIDRLLDVKDIPETTKANQFNQIGFSQARESVSTTNQES